MSQVAEVRRSLAAVARNRRLLRAQTAYGLFTVNELALWVVVLLWAYSAGGTSLAGLVAVLELVPAAALAPVGGLIGDRLRRDRALALVYGLQFSIMTVLAVLLMAHASEAAVVLAAVVATVLIAWARPPHYAATAELAAGPGEAAAANALSATLENLGFFLGPVLAGLGAGLGGDAVVAAGCAVLAAAGVALVSGLGLTRPGRLTAGSRDSADGRSRRSVSLVRAVLHRPAIGVVLLLVGAQFFAGSAMELVGLAYTSQQLGKGSAAAGLLIGSVGVGGMVGAAASTVLSGWRRLSGAVMGGLVVAGIPLLALTHLHSLIAALGVVVLTGAGLAFFAVAGVTLVQRSVDLSLVARVLAVRESAALAGLAVGAAVTPLAIRALGPGAAYATLGATLVVAAALAWPVLTRMEQQSIYRPEILRLLHGVDFLSVLGPQALEALALGASETPTAAGTVVVREGDLGDAYYLVQQGSLEVSVAGRSLRVLLGPGDGFGEIALLRNVPRTATVRACEDCILWAVDRESFLVALTGTAGVELAHRHVEQALNRLAPEAPAPGG